MLSNIGKDQICAQIQTLMGEVSYPHSIAANKITYIAGLTGDYQVLAIYQAALGQLVAKNADPAKQAALRDFINKLAKDLSNKEVDAYNSKAAWADKYGNIPYFKEDGKLKVKFGNDDPLLLPEPECDKCVDGKCVSQVSGKTYPCGCPLGDKWAKDSGYMGPATPAWSPKANKFGGLNTQAKPKTFGSGVKQGITNGQAGQAQIITVPAAPAVIVPEREEPKGRKFKEKI